MEIPYNEFALMPWWDFEYRSLGHSRRIERNFDYVRHIIASNFNSSGFSKKKVKAVDVMKLPSLDKQRVRMRKIPKERVLDLLRFAIFIAGLVWVSYQMKAESTDPLPPLFSVHPFNQYEMTDYKKTKAGVISQIYSDQKRNSIRRNHKLPTYTKQEFLDFCLDSDDFHKLYANWVKSNYDRWKKPSFDRACDSKGYSFDNFNRWITAGENKLKGEDDLRTGKITHTANPQKPVVGIHKVTGKQVIFHSMQQASRQLNISQSHISTCCNETLFKARNGKHYKRLTAGGYKWKFKT
jgi:hypothetical protein